MPACLLLKPGRLGMPVAVPDSVHQMPGAAHDLLAVGVIAQVEGTPPVSPAFPNLRVRLLAVFERGQPGLPG